MNTNATLITRKISIYALCVIICITIGLTSGLVTMTAVKTWYPLITKPHFNPPDWVFAPTWTLLYILMGISWGHMTLQYTEDRNLKIKAHVFFIIQLLINAIWSYIFFGAKQIGLAWLDLNLLLLFLIITTIYFFKISKFSGFLLLPYIAWVSFANILNGSIWWLN